MSAKFAHRDIHHDLVVEIDPVVERNPVAVRNLKIDLSCLEKRTFNEKNRSDQISQDHNVLVEL